MSWMTGGSSNYPNVAYAVVKKATEMGLITSGSIGRGILQNAEAQTANALIP